jgi:hypothetical protein
MRSLGPPVKWTLQINYPSRIFSRLIGKPAFPALRHHGIHQSASTRQDGANRRHMDSTEAAECSSTSLRDSNDSGLSLRTPLATKDSGRTATGPPIREPQPQLDEGPNSFLAFPEQSAQVSPNSAIWCAFSQKLLGWPCFESVSCSVYPDRETAPLWE